MYYAFPENKLLHFADTLHSDSLSVRVSPWVVGGWAGRLRSDTKLPRGKETALPPLYARERECTQSSARSRRRPLHRPPSHFPLPQKLICTHTHLSLPQKEHAQSDQGARETGERVESSAFLKRRSLARLFNFRLRYGKLKRRRRAASFPTSFGWGQ